MKTPAQLLRLTAVAVATFGLGHSASAAPIISSALRAAFASVAIDQTLNNVDNSSASGAAQLNAQITDSRSFPDGIDFITATASQDSDLTPLGFTYQSNLQVNGLAHHGIQAADGSAISVLDVTYELDAPYSYEFSITTQGATILNSTLPASQTGILAPGTHSFSFHEVLIGFESENSPDLNLTGATTITLRFAPLSAPDTGSMLTLFALSLLPLIPMVIWQRRPSAYARPT